MPDDPVPVGRVVTGHPASLSSRDVRPQDPPDQRVVHHDATTEVVPMALDAGVARFDQVAAPLERLLRGERFPLLSGHLLRSQLAITEREGNGQADHVRLDRARQDAVDCERRPCVEPGCGDKHDSQQPRHHPENQLHLRISSTEGESDSTHIWDR